MRFPRGREFPVKYWEVRRPSPEDDFSIEVSYRDLDGRSYTSIVEIRCTDSMPLDEPRATLQVRDVMIGTGATAPTADLDLPRDTANTCRRRDEEAPVPRFINDFIAFRRARRVSDATSRRGMS